MKTPMTQEEANQLQWLYPEYCLEEGKAILKEHMEEIIKKIFNYHDKELKELNDTTCDLYSLVAKDDFEKQLEDAKAQGFREAIKEMGKVKGE